MVEIGALEERLCRELCAEVGLKAVDDDYVRVSTPMTFPDGDVYTIYLKETPGGVRLSDRGHTMMRLSYETDIDKLNEGTRNKLLNQVLADADISLEAGALSMNVVPTALGQGIFKFGQGLTRIHDLSFLNRVHVESTFYEDLFESITRIVDASAIHRDYVVDGVSNARDYPVDYKIDTAGTPLFLFGVPSKDKARLATIILERLLREKVSFESLVVFQNAEEMPRRDLSRLMNAAGEMVASLDAQEDLKRKVLRKVA